MKVEREPKRKSTRTVVKGSKKEDPQKDQDTSVEDKVNNILFEKVVKHNTKNPSVETGASCEARNGGSLSSTNEINVLVVVLGELATGKSSIVKRYAHHSFLPHYQYSVSFLLCCA